MKDVVIKYLILIYFLIVGVACATPGISQSNTPNLITIKHYGLTHKQVPKFTIQLNTESDSTKFCVEQSTEESLVYIADSITFEFVRQFLLGKNTGIKTFKNIEQAYIINLGRYEGDIKSVGQGYVIQAYSAARYFRDLNNRLKEARGAKAEPIIERFEKLINSVD